MLKSAAQQAAKTKHLKAEDIQHFRDYAIQALNDLGLSRAAQTLGFQNAAVDLTQPIASAFFTIQRPAVVTKLSYSRPQR